EPAPPRPPRYPALLLNLHGRAGKSGMHVLFVHQNFPAQFGHVARYLVQKHGFRCTFLSQETGASADGIERIAYHVKGGATTQTHYCSATFENAIWHSHAVYEALTARPDL